jgi:hypothetical protein
MNTLLTSKTAAPDTARLSARALESERMEQREKTLAWISSNALGIFRHAWGRKVIAGYPRAQ